MRCRSRFIGLASLLLLGACSERAPQLSSAALRAKPQARSGEGVEGTSDQVERGRYLVAHAAACANCHSPRRADGRYDPATWLSGVECLEDVMPQDPEAGCVNTRNLTDHETGLKNRSDAQIKDMLLRGLRPDGSALHPFMPYAYFGNMREQDADAIVAYLRTVPGVDHTVPRSQPPFLPPERPTPRVDAQRIPMPRAGYPEREAALRGRYLAGEIGTCLICHTPRENGQLALDKAFQGGLVFERDRMGLPAHYPQRIYASNLTPHATGILGYSVGDIVRALQYGKDPNQGGQPLCEPMPAGPLGVYGGLTDADASDIAHYLFSLPPGDHPIPEDCSSLPPRAAETHARRR